jgi:hypothetical protein
VFDRSHRPGGLGLSTEEPFTDIASRPAYLAESTTTVLEFQKKQEESPE